MMKVRNLVVAFIFGSLLITSCGPTDNEIKIIQELEAQAYATPGDMDTSYANSLITEYLNYVENHPGEDSIAAIYLYKAAEINNSLGNHTKAITQFYDVHRKFPNTERAPYGLFTAGFVYYSDLNNKPVALQFYREFVDNYPNHALTESAQDLVKALSRTESDLDQVHEWLEQNEAAAQEEKKAY